MAPRSLQDQVTSLIGSTVAEQKYVGTQPTDVESAAVLQSIAMNLLLKPRSVLWLANLARNALQNVVTQELAAITALSQTVSDTGNTTFTPSSTLYLDTARTSLVQIEGLEKVDTASNDYQRFSDSVDNFLNKTLAKSVKKSGNTDLSRPDTEAAADLPNDFASLVALHSELNQRLFALSVGIENFTASPLGTILGLSTAYRARIDIEDVINVINSGDSASQLRDIAVRLIGDRAAVRTLGSLPVLDALLIDTLNGIPAGYVMKAETDPVTISVTGTVAPFVFSPGASASVNVNGNSLSAASFPQSGGIDIDNRAFLVSNAGITYPVTIPGGTYLFLYLRRATPASGYVLQDDGSYLKQVRIPFTAGPRTLSQVLTDLNSTLSTDATAYEYLQTGTGRIIIVGNSSITSLTIVSQTSEASTSSLGTPVVYNVSANALLGFTMGVNGISGTTPIGIVVDALNLYFSSLITATATSTQAVLVETLADTPGTSMTLHGDTSLGLPGSYLAQSASVRLFGTVLGVSTDPIDPSVLLDVGDLLDFSGTNSTVAGLSTTRITLDAPIDTFSGDMTATSALVTLIDLLDAAVQTFLASWLKTPYGQGLTTLDRAVAALSGKSTPATRHAVQTILSDLTTQVQGMATALATGPVPSNVGTDEQSVVNGIINTLTERKYDKALDLLLQLQVQEFFEMTGDTASYGGALMSSMAAIATTDIKFPNTQLDEASGLKGVIPEPEA